MSLPAQPPSPSPLPQGAAPAGGGTLRRLVVGLLIVACAGPLSMNLVDPDLWGHVRYGRDWLAEGVLPRTATHTYTAEGHRWINHENVAELLLTVGVDRLGAPGLLAAKLLLGLGVLLMMAAVARRRRVRPLVVWPLLLLVALNLQAFWLLRPQLLSFVLCAAMLWLLERSSPGWASPDWGRRRTDLTRRRRRADPPLVDWRPLLAAPPLFALWVNSHGGFVAGLAIFLAFLVGRGVEQLVWRGREGAPTVAALGAIGLAASLATLLNPYGVGLHAWLVGSLGAARPEITEWAPPTPDTPVFWPLVALALVAAGAFALSERRRDPVRIVILLLVGWQAASHLRHIAFFALLCGFWLPPHLQSVIGRLRRGAARGVQAPPLSPFARRGFAMALTLMIAVQAAGVARRLVSFPVDKSRYPVDALDWMAEHGARGKLVCNFNWSQYAIAALAPDVRVSFDGRFRTCYPQRVVDTHFDFQIGELGQRGRSPESGPIDPRRALRDGSPDYVLIDRGYWNPVGVMADLNREDDPEWALLYQDGVAQLWGRRTVVDDPASDRYVAAADRVRTDRVSIGLVEWPALPGEKIVVRPDAPAAGAPRPVAHRTPEAAPRGADG